MRKTVAIFLGGGLLLATLVGGVWFFSADKKNPEKQAAAVLEGEPETSLKELKPPVSKILQTDYHTFQTFNNCAPAALSMALSYYGIKVSQETLADDLRPHNNLKGDNDDKSTPPDELGAKAAEYGLVPYYRADGDIETIQKLIALDLPIVVRTLLNPEEDYAHYRVIKGYDTETREIIQDDSYQGKNQRYSYEQFLHIWQPFNYAYLVLVPKEKIAAVEAALGEEKESKTSWRNAITTANKELEKNPSSVESQFNKVVAYYYIGDFSRAIYEFEKVKPRLTRHVLWYQIEPIAAYYEVGNYEKVYSLTDAIINDNNKAVTELYLLRGESYRKEGNVTAAKQEFEKAVFYNKNSKAAQDALASIN